MPQFTFRIVTLCLLFAGWWSTPAFALGVEPRDGVRFIRPQIAIEEPQRFIEPRFMILPPAKPVGPVPRPKVSRGSGKSVKAPIRISLTNLSLNWNYNARNKSASCYLSIGSQLMLPLNTRIIAASGNLHLTKAVSASGRELTLPAQNNRSNYYRNLSRYPGQTSITHSCTSSMRGLSQVPASIKLLTGKLPIIESEDSKLVVIKSSKVTGKIQKITSRANVVVTQNKQLNTQYTVAFDWTVKCPNIDKRTNIYSITFVQQPILIGHDGKKYSPYSTRTSNNRLRQSLATGKNTYLFRVNPDFKFKAFQMKIHTKVKKSFLHVAIENIPLYLMRSTTKRF